MRISFLKPLCFLLLNFQFVTVQSQSIAISPQLVTTPKIEPVIFPGNQKTLNPISQLNPLNINNPASPTQVALRQVIQTPATQLTSSVSNMQSPLGTDKYLKIDGQLKNITFSLLSTGNVNLLTEKKSPYFNENKLFTLSDKKERVNYFVVSSPFR